MCFEFEGFLFVLLLAVVVYVFCCCCVCFEAWSHTAQSGLTYYVTKDGCEPLTFLFPFLGTGIPSLHCRTSLGRSE